jgi:hypothetical protein
MIPAAEQFSEREVRAMRDRVLGHPTGDKNWDACKDKWMQPEEVEWLQQQDAREPK